MKEELRTQYVKSLESRIETINSLKTKFFEGLASSFEFRQAQMQLYSFQQGYIQSMRDVVYKKTALNIIINNNPQ